MRLCDRPATAGGAKTRTRNMPLLAAYVKVLIASQLTTGDRIFEVRRAVSGWPFEVRKGGLLANWSWEFSKFERKRTCW